MYEKIFEADILFFVVLSFILCVSDEIFYIKKYVYFLEKSNKYPPCV